MQNRYGKSVILFHAENHNKTEAKKDTRNHPEVRK